MDINFDSTGGTGSVTYGLRCNGTVSFNTSATWIKNMRYGSGELTFTIDGNTVSSERTGTIIPSVDGTPCPGKTITVKQGGGSGPEPCDTHTVSSVTKNWDVTKDVHIVLDKESVGCDGGEITASLIGGVEHWQEVTSKIIDCNDIVISTRTFSAMTGENTETIESSTHTFDPIGDDGEDHDITYTFSFDYDGNNYQHTVHQICNWACPTTSVTSGDSGVTYFSIRKINIGEIDGADNIGCSGGTVTVSGATIGVNDYDKYYILSSITYDCHDTITDITTSRKMLEDSVKEPIALPISSYTINSINCGESSSNTLDYVYEYRDENSNLSSITTSFTVNQVCECEEECDEYGVNVSFLSHLALFDSCGNHLVYNTSNHQITSITTDGRSEHVNFIKNYTEYYCKSNPSVTYQYTPRAVYTLSGGNGDFAVLNGDKSLTSFTDTNGSGITVSVDINNPKGSKNQVILVDFYGPEEIGSGNTIVYHDTTSVNINEICSPNLCNDREFTVDFSNIENKTLRCGDAKTVSGLSQVCKFLLASELTSEEGRENRGRNEIVYDDVISELSSSTEVNNCVTIDNVSHDDETNQFTFTIKVNESCAVQNQEFTLTLYQDSDRDNKKTITFNVECGSGSEFTATHLYDTGQCSDINWIGSTGVSGYSSNFIITGTSSDDNGNYVEPVLSYPPGVQNKKWLMNVTHTGTSYTAEIYFKGEYDGILSLPLNLRQYENAGTYFPVNASLCKPVLNCYNWIDEVPPQSFPSAVTLHYGVERGVTPTYTGLHCPITIMAKVSGNTDVCRCSDNSGGHFIESGLSMDMSISGANMTHVFNASELPWECNDHSQGYCYPGKVFTEFSDYGWSFEEGENVKIIDTGSADIFNYKFVKTLNRKKLMNNTDENVTEEK